MVNDEWPISPTFLSLRDGCHEDTVNCNRDGIYYLDYLRGFIANLSRDKNIQNALSLFQFVPADFKPLDTNSDENNSTEGVSIIWNPSNRCELV